MQVNLGLKALLLIVAIILFVIAAFVNDPQVELALGFAVFAGSFLLDALPGMGGTTARRP